MADAAGWFMIFAVSISFVMGGLFTASIMLSVDGLCGELRKLRELWKDRRDG